MMDNAEIAETITEIALSKLDLKQILGSNFTAGDAEALGKKVGSFHQKFYRGVLAALSEPGEELVPPEVRTTPPVRKVARVMKQSKLNDVIFSRGVHKEKP